MAFNRLHTSAKAADVAKLLLVSKRQVAHILPCRGWTCLHVTLTVTLTLTQRDPNYHKNVTVLPTLMCLL